MLSFIFDLAGDKAVGDNYYNAFFNRFQTFKMAGLQEHPNTKTLMVWVDGEIKKADQLANQVANAKITETEYAEKMKAMFGQINMVLDQIQQFASLPYPSGSTGGGATSPGAGNGSGGSGGSTTTPGKTDISLKNPMGTTSIDPTLQWAILGAGGLLVFLTLNAVTKRG